MRFEKDIELLILEDIIQLEQVRAFLTHQRGVLSDRLNNINYWINMEQPKIVQIVIQNGHLCHIIRPA